MTISVRGGAALLVGLAFLITGCGTAATNSHTAPRSTTSTPSSRAASAPAVSRDELVAQAKTVLQGNPASLATMTEGLQQQNPTASAADIAAALQELNVNWKKQALRAAKVTSPGSTGTTPWLLANALTSEGKFTEQEARYAVKHVGLDWDEQAVMGFQHILKTGDGWSRSALINHVISVDHYTTDRANYAADHAEVDWNQQALKAGKASDAVTRGGLERELTKSGFTIQQADYAADALGFYTVSQSNAIDAAENYLDLQGFSRQGLIDQLSSSYGSGFSVADATFAVDHIRVDWNAQAVKAAKNYLDLQPFSRSGLISQLSSSYGSRFTLAQATYAADHVGL